MHRNAVIVCKFSNLPSLFPSPPQIIRPGKDLSRPFQGLKHSLLGEAGGTQQNLLGEMSFNEIQF